MLDRYLSKDLVTIIDKHICLYDRMKGLEEINKEYHSLWTYDDSYKGLSNHIHKRWVNDRRLNKMYPMKPIFHLSFVRRRQVETTVMYSYAWSSKTLNRNCHFSHEP